MKLIKTLLAVLLLVLAFPSAQISADEVESVEPLVGEAYAVFNSDEGCLTFLRTDSEGNIPAGDEKNTVYTGFENLTNIRAAATVPWHAIRSKITSVRVEATIRPLCMTYWFYSTNITDTATFENFDVSNVTDMMSIFGRCEKLESLEGLSSWKTTKLTSFGTAFYSCTNLKSLKGIEGFDTSHLSSLASVFSGCSTLESVDELAEWDTSNVYWLDSTFANCKSLKNVNGLAKWKTSNVRYMQWTFSGDENLTNLDGLKDWDVSGVWYMQLAFQRIGASRIESLANWDVSNVYDMDALFLSCKNLEVIDLSGWNTKDVGKGEIFSNCISLKEIKIGREWKFKGNNITSSQYYLLFPPAQKVENVYTGKWCNTKNMGDGYSSNELMDAYDGSEEMAGTWVWQEVRKDYVISFDANGGLGDTASIPASNWDQSVHLPESGFYRFDYQFIGWSETADGSSGLLHPGDEVKYEAEANETITLYAQWQKNDNKATPEDGWYEFTLKGDEEAVFKDLPTESPYSVYEETPDGWVLVESSREQGTVKPNEEAIAAFKNQKAPDSVNVQLTASKLLNDKTPEGQTFQFELLEDDKVIQTVNSSADGTILFKQISYREEGKHIYTIRETGLDTNVYESNSESFEVTVTVAKNAETGKLEASVAYPEGGVIFHNTTVVHKGSLLVSKTVEGAPATNPDFTFQIHLTNADGSAYSGVAEGHFGDTLTSLKNGDTFTLKAGQSVLFTMPEGVTYSVTEISIPDGYTVSQGTFTGTIQNGVEDTAAFTNTYEAKPASVILHARKTLTGGDLSDDRYQFTFELLDSKNQVVSTAANTPDGSVLFDELMFDQPGDYAYTIHEVKGELDEVTYDETSYSAVVHVTDPGNGQLVATVEYKNGDSVIGAPVFENRINPGSLSITKTVENETEYIKDREFTFTLSLKDKDGKALTDSYNWKSMTEGRSGSIKDGETLTLRNGEIITINDLPSGTEYSFEETSAEGFELTSGRNTSGTIQGGQTAEVSFVNTYQMREKPLELQLSKTLTGAELKDGQFTFQLKDKSGNVIQEVKNKADGSIVFEPIAVPADSIGKELKYTVTEVNDGQKFITFDEKTIEISVLVKDDGKGNMEFEITYPEEAVFKNKYEYVASGKLDLKAKKVLKDGTLKDGQFSFELVNAEGKVIQEVSNNAQGDIIFESISYTLENVGEHTYILREKKDPKLDNVVYDETEYEIKVTVTDNKDGTLKVTAEKKVKGKDEPVTELVFTNTWQEPVEMPSTGQPGIAQMTAAGLGIIAASALIIEERRKRRD
nr:FctA domain-containing protein [Faecalibaculum rodentium]